MAADGSVVIDVNLSASGVEKEISQLKKRLAALEGEGYKGGKKTGEGYSRGLASTGAIAGAAAAITSKALGVISSSADAAVKRVDTLNNFPKIMQNLGYSAEDAQSSLDKMNEKLDGLPTSLDAMVSATQKIAPLTGSLDDATEIALALNDALLAGGKATEYQENALEQFTQMLSVGKVDMEAWRSVVDAMPGQMNQLAESILGAGNNSMDLYEAMKDGRVSMGDFTDALLKLDKEGFGPYASFAEQAKTSTEGIGTAVQNAKTRVVKAIAEAMDAIGQENISGMINRLSSSIVKATPGIASAVASTAKVVVDNFDKIAGAFELLITHLPQLTAAFAGFKVAKTAVNFGRDVKAGMETAQAAIGGLGAKVTSTAKGMSNATGVAAKGMSALGGAMTSIGAMGSGPFIGISLAVAAISAAVGAAVKAWSDYQKHLDLVEQSTSGFEAASSDAISAVTGAAGALDDLGESAKDASFDIDEALQKQADHADSIRQIGEDYSSQIGMLDSARRAIEAYAGKTDLSTQEQGRLKAAIDIVNEACGTQYEVVDAANGAISDSKGNYDKAKAAAGKYRDEILKNIDAKKEELRQEALGEIYKEQYKARADALKAQAQASQELADAQAKYNEALSNGSNWETIKYYGEQMENAQKKVDETTEAVNSCNDALGATEEQMGSAAQAASGAATEFQRFANGGNGFAELLSASGKSVGQFEEDMGKAKASVWDLSSMSQSELGQMAAKYDGTSKSIRDAMRSMIDQNDKLSLSLYDSGVSFATLRAVGTDNLRKLSDACGGNVDAMTSILTAFDGMDLKDKHFEVSDDGSITVEMGDLSDLQRKKLSDKGFKVSDNGTVKISSGKIDDLKGDIKSVPTSRTTTFKAQKSASFNSIVSSVASKISSIARSITTHFNASGGYIPKHASGGYIPRFASGAIVTKPTLTRFGLVGEDGAEAVYDDGSGTGIYPLTNRRYMRPLAQTIAAEMPKGGSAEVLSMLSAISSQLAEIAGKDTDVYLDGQKVSSALYAASGTTIRGRGGRW